MHAAARPGSFKTFAAAGHWPTLFAAFLYFDFCFAIWVLNGAMAPFISEAFALTPAQKGFMISVPILAGALMRFPLGVLAQYIGRKNAALVEMGRLGQKTGKGWYAYAELQPWLRWALGARYDWSQYPVDAGREWAVEPYVTFWPSEFLRFRLAYKHTARSERSPFNDSGGNARLVDELLFQASFILGAHPAHPF